MHLKQGYEHFKKHPQKHDTHLAKTCVITCADARCDPGIIFNSKLNEIFVVRNVANIVPPCNPDKTNSVGAALEFAVKQLKITQLIIMGHTCCAGIKAFYEGSDYSFVNEWVEQLKYLPQTKDYDEASKLSVLQSHKHCLSYPFVKKANEENGLKIYPLFYDVKSCNMFIWDGSTFADF